MKKIAPLTKDPLPVLPDPEMVQELMLDWQKSLPLHIGDLFTRETGDGIERYDTYQLNSEYIPFIINNLDGGGDALTGGNILNFSIIMGRGTLEKGKEDDIAQNTGPTRNIFKPVLEVVLKEVVDDKYTYYFDLKPLDEIFALPIVNPSSKTNQEISPKVAELFILKWQSLTEGELIRAFEGLAANSATMNSKGEEKGEVIFSGQRLRRVEKYTFDDVETKAVIEKLKEHFKEESEEVAFFVNLGAGLIVPNFHPFNFRPIIKILATEKSNSRARKEKGVDTDLPISYFFDTSKPCPPFCSGSDPDLT